MSRKKLVVKEQAAQGDLLVRRIERIPVASAQVVSQKGQLILAHSETGHHHAISLRQHPGVAFFRSTVDELVAYLDVPKSGASIVHHRSFDTHKPLSLEKGTYEIRRQREYVPEGWRRVED